MLFCRIKARIFSPIGVLRPGQGRNLTEKMARDYEAQGLVEIQGMEKPPVQNAVETKKEAPAPEPPKKPAKAKPVPRAAKKKAK